MPFVIGIEYTKTESNVGTLMRSAVNFGAAMVFTVGRRYRRQASDTMHAAHQIPVLHFASWEEAQKHLPSEWTPIAVELGEGAHRLESFVHPKRAIYVLGPEDGSVSDEAQRWCKSKVVIPSLRCLNVAVAGSIVMYDRIAKGRMSAVNTNNRDIVNDFTRMETT